VRLHATVVWLHVAAYNYAACALYEACGFACLRQHIDFYCLNTKRLPNASARGQCDAFLYALAINGQGAVSDPVTVGTGVADQPAGLLAAYHDVQYPWLGKRRRRHADPGTAESETGDPSGCRNVDMGPHGHEGPGVATSLSGPASPGGARLPESWALWHGYGCFGTVPGADLIDWYRFFFNRRNA
jgi:hypothetical protein